MQLPSVMTLAVAFLALGAQANPMANPEANPLATLEKRADNRCRVVSSTACRSVAGGGGSVVRTIPNDVIFGVRCTKFVNERTWDWIPGWGCWVSARETRSADTAHSSCESGLPRC